VNVVVVVVICFCGLPCGLEVLNLVSFDCSKC
jgi:hypothetical protein